MKILFAGGGSGGHFYPLIAIIQELNTLVEERKLVSPRYFYAADEPYDEKTLFEYGVEFVKIRAGKVRLYSSRKNILDVPRTALGIIEALWKLFFLYPDVIVGKGGYSSFPTIVAARLLRIPLIIHESDAVPGRVNLFGGKFARRVGIAYEEAANFFPKETTALIGIPVRRELQRPKKEGAVEFLKLESDVPVIYVTGGSQGAQTINDCLYDILPDLVKQYQIIHQAGNANAAELRERLGVVLSGSEHKERYKLFGFLTSAAQAMVAGVAKLVITRAGSTTLFEVAQWGIPAIVIPIPESVSRDQTRNAFNYARVGAGVLLEEANLTPHILLSEIERIMGSSDIQRSMAERARAFAKPDAGRKMAEAILEILLSHEK